MRILSLIRASLIPLLCGLGFVMVLAQPVAGQVDSTLSRVRSAGVDSTKVPRQLLFSPGYASRATDLASLLAEADRYFEAELALEVDFVLATLDEPEWARVWPFPYGIPYVSLAAPWVVVMPATPERSVMYPMLEGLVGTRQAATMIDNIGFHEVGHIYASEYFNAASAGSPPAVRWFDEFLATYLAYCFLREVDLNRVAVWTAFVAASLDASSPRFTSLADFEAEYYEYLASPEGAANYSWYQAAFAELAAEVYEGAGLALLSTLRDRLGTSEWTQENVLRELEAAAPGSRAWAERLSVGGGA